MVLRKRLHKSAKLLSLLGCKHNKWTRQNRLWRATISSAACDWLAVYERCICTFILRSIPGLRHSVIKSRTSQDLCSYNWGFAVEATSLRTAAQSELRMSAQLVLFNEVMCIIRGTEDACFFIYSVFGAFGCFLESCCHPHSFDTMPPCLCKPNRSGIWAITKLFELANFAKASFIPRNGQYMAYSAFHFKQAYRSFVFCAPCKYRSLSANFYSVL